VVNVLIPGKIVRDRRQIREPRASPEALRPSIRAAILPQPPPQNKHGRWAVRRTRVPGGRDEWYDMRKGCPAIVVTSFSALVINDAIRFTRA